MANKERGSKTLENKIPKNLPTALPLDGEYFRTSKRKSDVVVFFVHFYKGNKKLLRRHIEAVNELGFDAFAFNLKDQIKSISDFPASSSGQFGLKHCLADQIEMMLNLVPEKKIVFAFSNPTAAAIEAIGRRHCTDILALIADSGPSGKYLKSALNLFNQENQFKFWPVRLALTPLASLAWSPQLHKDLYSQLALFPAGFRILSIRGWKDTLIPPDHIDAVFEPHSQLDWSKLSLPEAKHLKGLKDFPDEYLPAVEQFLGPFVQKSNTKQSQKN